MCLKDRGGENVLGRTENQRQKGQVDGTMEQRVERKLRKGKWESGGLLVLESRDWGKGCEEGASRDQWMN